MVLTNTCEPIKSDYEQAKAEGGLISLIKNSTLPPLVRDSSVILFRQLDRALYTEQNIAFPTVGSHTISAPVPRLQALRDNPYYIHYILSAICGVDDVKGKPNSLIPPVEKKYSKVRGGINRLYGKFEHELRRSKEFPDINNPEEDEHIKWFLQEFYDWNVRPALTAARVARDNKLITPKNSEAFDDLMGVYRTEMRKIHGELVGFNGLDGIARPAAEILKKAGTIDNMFTSQESWERKIAVSLYSSAFFLNYVALDRERVKNAA